MTSGIRANRGFNRLAYFEDLARMFDQWARDSSPFKHLMTETDPHSKMYLEKPVMDNAEILVTFIAITITDL